MAILSRTYRGNAEVTDSRVGELGAGTTSPLSDLVHSARTPMAAYDALVYSTLAAVGRVAAQRAAARAAKVAWERDETSRAS